MNIRKPVITEKTLSLYKDKKIVVFEVGISSNKTELKKELEKLFNVEVANVRVVNRLGKYKYSRYSSKTSKLSDKKLAYFRLTKGEIEIFNEK